MEKLRKIRGKITEKGRILVAFSLSDNNFFKNTPNRCYYCKKESSRVLKEVASENGVKCIADGVNLSDFDEYRPGIRACNEEGI
jgi:uncharacterized protein